MACSGLSSVPQDRKTSQSAILGVSMLAATAVLGGSASGGFQEYDLPLGNLFLLMGPLVGSDFWLYWAYLDQSSDQ